MVLDSPNNLVQSDTLVKNDQSTGNDDSPDGEEDVSRVRTLVLVRRPDAEGEEKERLDNEEGDSLCPSRSLIKQEMCQHMGSRSEQKERRT